MGNEHFKFYKVVYTYIAQVRYKTFTSFCSKFILETVYQISSVLLEF